jgi:recombination protein RecA
MYGEGISREGDLLDLAATQNIVEKSGAWYSYKGERIGQGRENARQFLKDNKDIAARVDLEVRKALGLIREPEPAPLSAEEKEKARKAAAQTPPSSGGRVTTMPSIAPEAPAKIPAARR